MLATIGLCAALLAGPMPPLPGDDLAPFVVRAMDGAPYRWSPGKAAVVSFCAFWCDTWKQQLPRVEQAKRSLQGLPIAFLNVSIDGRWMEKAKGAPGLVLSDKGGKWSSRLGIDRVPYALVVDPKGVIRWTKFGIARSQDLVREARAALHPPVAGPAYLTFDDFPWATGNDELLDLLGSLDVHATFFCIGQNAEFRPDAMRRAAREGHSLQMHSWAHEAGKPELPRCKKLLANLTGHTPTLYRPPGSEAVLGSDGKRLVLPVADPYDYLNPSPEEIARRVALSIKPGGVIQLHGGLPNTLAALPAIVANLRKRGYTFALLPAGGNAKPQPGISPSVAAGVRTGLALH